VPSDEPLGNAELSWPNLAWEEHAWAPSIPPDLVSHAVRARHSGPYLSAVVPTIKGVRPRVPDAVAALVADASAEIARFDAEIGAELAPFASVLLRSESASSSMIENLSSGAKAIVLAEMGSTSKLNASLIVGNVAAMNAALNLADRLDTEAILAMHRALMRGHDDSIAGRWRDQQVWIGGDFFGPHGAMFVPPYHSEVPGLMDDLVAFTNRTDLPLLTQAAIAHAQFETIHPFPDGNGRTGRALVHAMLRGHRLTRKVTVPVSAGLLADTRAYFDTLTAYRDGDPVPIVEMLAQASLTAMVNARQLVDDLREIRTAWDSKVKARRGAAAWRLADLLLRQPLVDAPTVAYGLGISPDNAMRPIAPLVEAGVLTEFTGFARNRMWQSREVLSALDDFAARAGRRTLG
jgi:Fic family protein